MSQAFFFGACQFFPERKKKKSILACLFILYFIIWSRPYAKPQREFLQPLASLLVGAQKLS